MSQAAEDIIFGGSIRRAIGRRRRAVTSYCRLRGGKGLGKWRENKVGLEEEAICPRCGKEEDTPDHIVFLCMKTKRVKDKEGRGRREWVREAGVRWDSWEALASKQWVRMEDSGQSG